ncbi:MAG TPA: hypothetical protein VGW40_07495 [Allosphingosinicella sp.]|nr:hypothetical protein [Allosphingosinicella sp.]
MTAEAIPSSPKGTRISKEDVAIRAVSLLGLIWGITVVTDETDPVPLEMTETYRRSFEGLLAEELQGEGLTKEHAFSLAAEWTTAVQQIRKAPRRAVGATGDRALAKLLVGLASRFHAVATENADTGLALPPRADAVWSNPEDRVAGENPIQFLERVWGPYMKAGVLYQDDIKRLGDDKLVRAIHSYCQKHPEHTATEVLPPPRRVRLERALAAAPPDSPEAAAIRTRLAMREAGQRARAKRRQAPKP